MIAEGVATQLLPWCAVCFSPVCSFEAPLAGMLTERRHTVRKEYEALQQRRALQDTTNHHRGNTNLKDVPSAQPNAISSIIMQPGLMSPALHLDSAQKLQLQQQIQQVGDVATPPAAGHGEGFRADGGRTGPGSSWSVFFQCPAASVRLLSLGSDSERQHRTRKAVK